MTATATKSKSIILSADEVRAVQAGRKSQFRQPDVRLSDYQGVWASKNGMIWSGNDQLFSHSNSGLALRCPYRVGDLIAVKERYACIPGNYYVTPHYLVDGPMPSTADRHDAGLLQIRSARSMPPIFVRHFLPVTAVKVERLQSISEEDSYLEGASSEECSRCNGTGVEQYGEYKGMGCEDCDGEGKRSCRKMFRDSWDSRRARKPDQQWAANPWVWAVAFTVEKK